MREEMTRQHAMPALYAYVEMYGPAVNDLTSSWTQKYIFGVRGSK